MQIKEVNFKRYVPDSGKVIKFKTNRYNYNTNNVEVTTIYSVDTVILDEQDIWDIEEITLDEYKEQVKKESVGLCKM